MKNTLKNTNRSILVIGSSCSEVTYTLPEGIGHQEDATLTAFHEEQTFGGAGLCNSLALARTNIGSVQLLTPVGGKNGQPDTNAQLIKNYITNNDIAFYPQLQKSTTEQTVVFLSGVTNDSKRAFRLLNSNGSLARDTFKITDDVRLLLRINPVIMVSSLKASIVAQLAREFHSLNTLPKKLFIWTINHDSANAICHDKDIQNVLQEGLIDVLLMSQTERSMINPFLLSQVKLEVITKGEKGCEVIDRSSNPSQHIIIPAFSHTDHVVNDNGAGEAHHANFIATILTSMTEGEHSRTLRKRILETAGNIGNLAGYVKVLQPHSLWFPSFCFQSVHKEIVRSVKTPREIAYDLFAQFLQQKKALHPRREEGIIKHYETY